MRKSIVLLLVALFFMPLGDTLYAASRKKKKDKDKTEEVAPEKKESKYDKLLKKPGVKTVKGEFITLHRIDNLLIRAIFIAADLYLLYIKKNQNAQRDNRDSQQKDHQRVQAVGLLLSFSRLFLFLTLFFSHGIYSLFILFILSVLFYQRRHA